MIATAVVLAGLVCPVGTVPGWLDESGNSTSCIADCPYGTATECKAFTDAPQLAETGMPDWVLPAGVMLALGGLAVVAVGRTRSS